MLMVCFEARPVTPPSASAELILSAQVNQINNNADLNQTSNPVLTALSNFWKELKQYLTILLNIHFDVLMLAFGVGTGIFYAFSTLLEPLITPAGYKSVSTNSSKTMY